MWNPRSYRVGEKIGNRIIKFAVGQRSKSNRIWATRNSNKNSFLEKEDNKILKRNLKKRCESLN